MDENIPQTSSTLAPQEGEEQQPLTRKERKALKRAQKQEDKDVRQQHKQTKKWALWGIIGIAVIGGVWGLILLVSQQEPVELGTDFSRAVAYEGANHIQESENARHQSNPPTSGQHWPFPLRSKIYDTEKPDEAVIHSMEHGRVWVSYKPSIPEDTKKALEAFIKTQGQIVLTPRSANDTDIALAAWNRLDTFDLNPDGTFDENRIRSFIQRYRNKGPESVSSEQGTRTY